MSKKTIKFYDKDAADHKFGQGGGGFVVKFTKNAQDEVTCDKTFAEISAKIAAGNDVIGYVTGADGMTYAMLPTIKAGTSGVVFSATFYDDQNKGIVYQVECYKSEGHDFFEWSVVELAGGGGDTPIEIALNEDNVLSYYTINIGTNTYINNLNYAGVIVNNKKIGIFLTVGGSNVNIEAITYANNEGEESTSITLITPFQINEEVLLASSPKLVIY